MFFSANIFKEELNYLTNEQREHIARLANQIIEDRGILCWGRGLKEKQVRDFTSLKGKTSTHVGVLIGVKEMAIFEEDDLPIKRDLPAEAKEFSVEDQLEYTKRELHAARLKIASQPVPIGPQ